LYIFSKTLFLSRTNLLAGKVLLTGNHERDSLTLHEMVPSSYSKISLDPLEIHDLILSDTVSIGRPEQRSRARSDIDISRPIIDSNYSDYGDRPKIGSKEMPRLKGGTNMQA
jgi:hypothetical protein